VNDYPPVGASDNLQSLTPVTTLDRTTLVYIPLMIKVAILLSIPCLLKRRKNFSVLDEGSNTANTGEMTKVPVVIPFVAS
jgi:hypothetical protein